MCVVHSTSDYTFKRVRSEALLPFYNYPKSETCIIRFKRVKRIIASTSGAPMEVSLQNKAKNEYFKNDIASNVIFYSQLAFKD